MPRWGRARRAGIVIALALLAQEAGASNYFLEQIGSVATRGEIHALRQSGVRTTDELAWRASTPAARVVLAGRSGIDAARLAVLGSLADLMRLRGIGPDAARVLNAAGCQSIGDLQRADPHGLADAVKRVNDRARLSQNPPRAENLSVWIAAGRRLPRFYEPDPPAAVGAEARPASPEGG